MKNLSIRWKLTLWYGFAVSVTLFAFGIILLILTRQQLLNRTDAALREELRELALEVEITPSEADFRLSTAKRFFHHDIYDFVVVHENGATVFLSSGLSDRDVAAILPDRSSSVIRHETRDVPESGPFRIAGLSCDSSFGRLTVCAVTSLKPLMGEMYVLQMVTAILLPLAVASALAGGYFLASRVLAPVNAIVEMANSVTIDSLNCRVEVHNPRDEIGRLAATLNSLIERLELAVHEIKRFTADASHEIRTPLAALRMEAELALRAGRSPEQYKFALRVVVDEATRLGRLADQLLSLSRHDAGIVECVRASVHLDAILQDVVEQLQPMASHHGVLLKAARIQPCQVHGDDVGLRQVVYNVVENALKFTNNGGTVVIQCTTRQGTVVCEVVDTGVGITDEHLPHIFNRFYRVDSSRHSESGGAGLGLSIARTIVLAHGGTIEICSRPNTGTTVSICLPKMETLNCCPNGADERDLGEPSFATIKTELVAN
ncbi:MAG: HAMP domain-containing sensor histidine kinase [Planctomycetales bacterium]|nr:HAMP domain-containing sensor histidine kinase [Planctomycetales bacterium]